MYSVASKTNGMGAIEYDERFRDVIWWFPTIENLYPVYAMTIQVSGSETTPLPDFNPSVTKYYWTAIAYQDHVPIDSFRSLNLRWTNSQDYGNFSVNSNNITDGWYGGTYVGNRNNFYGGVNYNIALDYNYSGEDVQNLQIRIYSSEPTSNWLPYSD
ncbi:hypothetical protein B9Z55_029148 [Caenorhabditis nigoni]|nr:hypothetical protein B9Z55_029148 [Caenorhabditis nigoni]